MYFFCILHKQVWVADVCQRKPNEKGSLPHRTPIQDKKKTAKQEPEEKKEQDKKDKQLEEERKKIKQAREEAELEWR